MQRTSPMVNPLTILLTRSNLLAALLITISTLMPGLTFGQITLDNLGLSASEPAEVAFSLRKMSTVYTGPAIQVRRSSDNATQNIGFTAGGDLDQAALLAFVGSGNGFVSIWYDQSGNGRDVTAAIANQPQIVQSGVVLTNSTGKARVLFNGTTAYLTNTTYVPTTQPIALSAVWQFNSLTSPGAEICGWGANSGAGSRFGAWIHRVSNTQGNFGIEYQGAGLVGQSVIANAWYISTQVLPTASTSSLTQRLNGTPETLTQLGSPGTFNITAASSEFAIGTIPIARSQGLNGSIQEIVLFASTLSTPLLQTIENNQTCYYSTVPAITFNTNIGVPIGATSATINYTNPLFSPNTYSISWSAAALAAGFTDITGAALPAGSISLSVPASLPGGTPYTGTLTVMNMSGCAGVGVPQPFSVSILNPILGTTQLAEAAYSVRRLSPSYTGNAIRVRRSSDNATQDIGFTASGDLNETALLAFVGTGNGFITTWYDQSGYGRDVVQATPSNQPRIVNAGVVQIQNSRPALFLNGTSSFLTQATTTVSNPYTANVVAARTASSTGYQRLVNFGATSDGFGFIGTLNGNFATFVGAGGTFNDINANTPNTPVGASSTVLSMTVNAGSTGLVPYLNGTAIGTKNGTVNTSTGFQIGSPYAGNLSQLWTGNIQEFTLFATSLPTSDRQAIENNQQCYYSVLPSLNVFEIPGVPANAPAATLEYTSLSSGVTSYSITWSAAALAAGFTNVVNAPITASPIAVTLPAVTAAGGMFTGNFTVANSCGVTSINYPISVRILHQILGTSQLAQTAYSIRRLSPTYTGSAIRVRRSSDSASQDIGFTAAGDLDQAALLAFVGTGNGFITTWYDQSGNARHLTAPTVARQPAIVTAGVVNLRNARPALVFDGADDQLSLNTFPTTGFTGFTANMLGSWTTVGTTTGTIQVLLDNNHTGSQGFVFQDRPDLTNQPLTVGYTGGGANDIITTGNNTLTVMTMVADATTVSGYRNGFNYQTGTRSGPFVHNNILSIGAWANGPSRFLNGAVPEVIIFANSVPNAQRQSIETNQLCYYSVSPTITLTPSPGLPPNSPTASLSYTAAAGYPTTYSITWDAAAIAAGFTNLVDVSLPASPITVTLPAVTPVGAVYNGTLTVKNACGVTSINYPISVRILNLILGTTQTAQAAYSVRRLASSYTGPALRVRRSSDNTTQDIGFTASGDLDQAALLAFVGTSNGFVTIWYDQSGNARHATQTNTTRQPRIVNGGVIDLANTRPTLSLLGNQNMVTSLTNAQAATSSIQATVSSVFRTNDNVNQSLLGGNLSEFNIHAPWSDGITYFDLSNGGSGRLAGALSWPALATATFLRDGALAEVYRNGVNSLNSNTRNTSHTFSNNNIVLFSSNNNSAFTQGIVPEMILFSVALPTADRQTIETNQACYYSIQPAITTLIPAVPANAPAAVIQYTPTLFNPVSYSITWSASALAAGFTNVTNAVLPAGQITVSMPAGTMAGQIFTGTLTVATACGVQSVNYPIQLGILNPVLSTTQTAQAAYSVRRIASAYSGPAMRVRRSSDNATQDIGFTASGDLDQAALLSFVGSNDGFVTVWYDQSGNMRNATQTNTTQQPRIVSAGVIDLANTRPTLSLLGNQNMVTSLTNAQATGAGITATFSAVFRTNNSVNQSLISGNLNEYNIHAPWSDGNTYFDVSNSGTGRLAGALSWSNLSAATFRRNGAIAQVYRNGIMGLSSNSRNTSHTFSNNNIVLFSYSNNSSFTQGIVPEMIFFSTPISESDRQAIETSQDCYYSLGIFANYLEWRIQNTPASGGCLTVDEQIEWRDSDLLNVTATGNNLLKVSSNGTWNGGAASWNTVQNNGYFQFTATETNTNRMAGLSNGNANADWTGIQYAVYLRNDAQWEVRQSGSGALFTASYSANDVFRIAVENNVVRYYQNNILRYISLVTPTLPLLVDVSINTQGGTVTNAIVSNYSNGNFTSAISGPYTSVSYQWILNGANVGTNSPTYNNTSLINGDVLSCTASVQIGGCSQVLPSPTLTVRPVLNPTNIDFYITGNVASAACNVAEEAVVWRPSELLNTQAIGNSLLKIQSNGTWNGGAASFNTVANNGYLQFTATETNTARMVGLSNTNTNADWTAIQYVVYLRNDAQWEVRQSGGGALFTGPYAASDVFRIAVENNVVRYYQNNVLRYISLVTPTLPLLVDVSINTQGGTVTNAVVANLNAGVFTATATNAGTSPTYQWKLNGANVGTNSATYTNTSLVNGDQVTCQLTPNLGGCAATTYTSNIITNRPVTNSTSIDFYVTGTPATSGCIMAEEDVQWSNSSLLNTQATGNNLLKIQSNGNWNGGAASWNTVSNNGYFQFTATETNTARMV
ncbi:MAG: arabinofuranosidase catalytic domain-containing protein, partial [Flavobacteriales bacterium]